MEQPDDSYSDVTRFCLVTVLSSPYRSSPRQRFRIPRSSGMALVTASLIHCIAFIYPASTSAFRKYTFYYRGKGVIASQSPHVSTNYGGFEKPSLQQLATLPLHNLECLPHRAAT